MLEFSAQRPRLFEKSKKNVRKDSVMCCMKVRYGEICEGCESEKVELPVTYAREGRRIKREIVKGCERCYCGKRRTGIFVGDNHIKTPTFSVKHGSFSNLYGRVMEDRWSFYRTSIVYINV